MRGRARLAGRRGRRVRRRRGDPEPGGGTGAARHRARRGWLGRTPAYSHTRAARGGRRRGSRVSRRDCRSPARHHRVRYPGRHHAHRSPPRPRQGADDAPRRRRAVCAGARSGDRRVRAVGNGRDARPAPAPRALEPGSRTRPPAPRAPPVGRTRDLGDRARRDTRRDAAGRRVPCRCRARRSPSPTVAGRRPAGLVRFTTVADCWRH